MTSSINRNFLAPCGLYCGVCGVYYATRDNNAKFMEKLLANYQRTMPGLDHLTIKDLECDGCLSGRKSVFCRHCAIRDCVQAKGLEGCHRCADFPCGFIDNFPMPVGKKVIMRAIPYWRGHGTETWVRDEEARYTCPDCGHILFRGAKRCNRCSIPVDRD
ncbi:MAG TPA: DUF3795 domain-containing protein [Spirochaetota bacterium]|nr:DUF3795 domain-containing protein [Spirochaetota bacterium]